MGKVAKVTTPDAVSVTLSMIKWGMLRRGVVRAMGETPTKFVPRYEIAVFAGEAAGKVSFFGNMLMKGFYADKASVIDGWNELGTIIQTKGLMGLWVLVETANPLKKAYYVGSLPNADNPVVTGPPVSVDEMGASLMSYGEKLAP